MTSKATISRRGRISVVTRRLEKSRTAWIIRRSLVSTTPSREPMVIAVLISASVTAYSAWERGGARSPPSRSEAYMTATRTGLRAQPMKWITGATSGASRVLSWMAIVFGVTSPITRMANVITRIASAVPWLPNAERRSDSPSVEESMLTNMLPTRIEVRSQRGLARSQAMRGPRRVRESFFTWNGEREKRVVSVQEKKNEQQSRARIAAR